MPEAATIATSSTRPTAPGRTRPRMLKAHGVWLRPVGEAHGDLGEMVRAIAGGKPGFVDAPALSPMAPMAQVIMADGDGNLFALDTSSPTPVIRPWTKPAPGTPEPRRTRRPTAPGPRNPHNGHAPGHRGRPETTNGSADSGRAPSGAADGTGPADGATPRDPSTSEQVMMAAGQQLATQFMTALFAGQPIGPALAAAMDPGNILSSLGGAAIQNLGNMLMGSLMGALFGGVTDASSLGSQLAAKFAPQLTAMAQDNMGTVLDAVQNGGVSPDVMDQIQAYFFGVASAASIPLGKAMEAGAAGYVLVEGGPHALKVDDLAPHVGCTKPPGTYVEGHPTILINGKPAVGKGHKAICGCGQPVMPKVVAATVLMGTPPAATPGGAAGTGGSPGGGAGASGGGSGGAVGGGGAGAGGGSAGTPGDSCNPSDVGSQEALSENEEGPDRLGRPLVCTPDANSPLGGTVERPAGWDPPQWLRDVFGMKDVATRQQQAQGIQDWSLLWGAIEIGGPQQPEAGTAGSWWLPDEVFGYDMSPYYLTHDRVFDDDRNLSQIGAVLAAEWEAFQAGLRGRFDPGLLVLQMLYSGATTTAGLTSAAANTIKGRPPAKRR